MNARILVENPLCFDHGIFFYHVTEASVFVRDLMGIFQHNQHASPFFLPIIYPLV